MTIISLRNATNITEGYYVVGRVLVALVFLYTLSTIGNKEALIKSLIFLAVFIGVYGIYEYFTIASSHRVGFMSNRNLWSSTYMLLLPFCIYGWSFSKRWRYLCITIGILLLFNIVMLMTRSVWLALVGASVVTLIVFRKFPLKIVILGFILICIFLMVRGYKTIYYHTIGTDSVFMRFETWGRTLKMCRDKPWGVGAGNWKIDINYYGNEYNATSPEGILRSERFMLRPHNDPLWVLSETGVIGLGFYVTIFLMSLYYAYKRGNKAMFFGIVCYMGFAFFSFPMERAFHSMVLLVMISMVIPVRKMICASMKLIYVSSLTVTILLMMTAGLYAIGYRSEVMMRKVIVLRGQKNWPQVINTIDGGYSRLATIDPILATPIIFYRAEAYLYLRNARQSFEDFKRAYQLNPYHIYAIENLASSYAIQGYNKKAIELYEKVLEISPSFEPARNNLEYLRSKL